MKNLVELLQNNPYPGRGIVVGKDRVYYWIMGRSTNSRNRVFTLTDDGIRTEAHDPSLLEDPSLIIYHPVRTMGDKLVVTNGDQTDTIVEAGDFRAGCMKREYEPDAPNFTPRISGILYFENGFNYEMSILKSIDESGSDCCRYTYSYPSVAGLGHFIHTYNCNGDPLPTFTGEPHRVNIKADIEEFANEIWESLNGDNKISLYVRYTDIKTGKYTDKIINKNGR